MLQEILNGHAVTDSRSKLIPSSQTKKTDAPDNLLKSSATLGTDGIVLVSHWNDLPDCTVTARTPDEDLFVKGAIKILRCKPWGQGAGQTFLPPPPPPRQSAVYL